MESFPQWFQDWAEACSYAQECVPELPPIPVPHEPWSALGFIAVLCWALWRINERGLTKILAREARFAGRDEAAEISPPLNSGEVGAMFHALTKRLRSAPTHKAA